jgi:hypothetical protein
MYLTTLVNKYEFVKEMVMSKNALITNLVSGSTQSRTLVSKYEFVNETATRKGRQSISGNTLHPNIILTRKLPKLKQGQIAPDKYLEPSMVTNPKKSGDVLDARK